ncbi:MAG: hypothetical protein PHG02_00395 [Oscillospiraceae bacterium]|nr:hypothetical protein [Oscillospiraceae bacterium]
MSVQTNWQQYQDGLQYQQSMGFRQDFPAFERFKEGHQWNTPTADNADFPRPVFNIVEMFIKAKRASVTNQSIAIHYSPAMALAGGTQAAALAAKGAADYTDFARILWSSAAQDELNDDFIDDAATLGTGILHYYWSNDVTTASRRTGGDIRGDVVDPLNVFFGNPQCKDVQKQPYVIITSRERVQDVRAVAKRYGVGSGRCSQILPDADYELYDAAKENTPHADGEKVTVLTRYFRKDGQVYFEKTTKNAQVVPPTPLTPKTAKAPITLYPLVVLNWRKRKRCIYGIGEAQDLITINKAYNLIKAYSLYSVQQLGSPKIIRRAGAIQEPITNEPGQILTDRTSDGNGIKYLNPPAFGSFAGSLANEVFEMARTVTGVTGVSTGESIAGNMAASAIIALQNQAKTPIKEISRRYFRAMEQVGRIWEQFFKTYYALPRAITVTDADGVAKTRAFVGTRYADVDFKLAVDVGTSSEYGEELAIATLDRFYDKGEITLEQYLQLAPRNVVPFKEQLKKMLEAAAKSATAQNAAMAAVQAPQGGAVGVPPA